MLIQTQRRISARRNAEVDGWRVADEVATSFAITLRALRGPGRNPKLCEARAEVARRLRLRGWTLANIGDLLDRHHTTVMAMLESA